LRVILNLLHALIPKVFWYKYYLGKINASPYSYPIRFFLDKEISSTKNHYIISLLLWCFYSRHTVWSCVIIQLFIEHANAIAIILDSLSHGQGGEFYVCNYLT